MNQHWFCFLTIGSLVIILVAVLNETSRRRYYVTPMFRASLDKIKRLKVRQEICVDSGGIEHEVYRVSRRMFLRLINSERSSVQYLFWTRDDYWCKIKSCSPSRSRAVWDKI